MWWKMSSRCCSSVGQAVSSVSLVALGGHIHTLVIREKVLPFPKRLVPAAILVLVVVYRAGETGRVGVGDGCPVRGIGINVAVLARKMSVALVVMCAATNLRHQDLLLLGG